jgi:NAD+ diphosphatase
MGDTSYYLVPELSAELFDGSSWEEISKLRQAVPKQEVFAGVTGFQLYGWYRTRRFCPACGRPMIHGDKERMLHCTSCGQVEYPKICPAVIVGVTNGDRLLLTKYADRDFKKYALVAGFAEIGETIEETVHREVLEETGLRVKNLRYYKSQPWSFSDTLLFGFFAELDGDPTVHLDDHELALAKWCTREEIPEDDGISLTREMMRVFREGNA